ncbi:FxsA family protein [Corynebacterium lizhenjunii]|uniref:FxsA family protein n=1 Tax=Corynebacterium lizhenjunii TaxID=2709394 RepID=A0A7T0KHU1_9CORY|nr:FxsA family protein [Corynebacterium lizhenjunii]QPK80179.1 FxsA family protein [Corynebacterium lizhenjunii]
MPLLYFFFYFVVETVAFWAMVKAIGLGWTLVALFATMIFGMSVAMWEVRRLLAQQASARTRGSTGALAGNVGLTIMGGLLLTVPGFVSSAFGLLLMFPPTRALMRRALGVRLVRGLEDAGVRFYQASPMADAARATSYGSFRAAGGPEVIDAEDIPADAAEDIDEEEITRWSQNVDPDDFGRPER